MATNLAIDQDLIIKAQKLGAHKTKREAVNAALEEYIRFHQQLEAIKLFGTIDFVSDYDYKKGRQNRERPY